MTQQPADPFWKPGDIIEQRYRVEETMSGAMGHVYIATHLDWHMRMAIKSPRPEVLADKEGLRSILREANNWIRLGMHPNIASCFYVLNINDTPHIFVEYVDGGSLADWIKIGRCRDLRTSLSLAIQFCHGMEYTHGHGIIHRDIKPANILLTRNALLKITDFGILLSLHEQKPRADKLNESEIPNEITEGFRGTPGYASPEQFVNASAVDRRCDIFSFGICLWLMLCGRKPYAKNFVEQPIPDPLPQDPSQTFPPSLQALLKKCVAFSADDRFSDFAALRVALHDAYIDLFQFPCPYFEVPNLDLRADSLNNRGVSLFELDRAKEAMDCFNQALDINENLLEAQHNRLLLQWIGGEGKPERLLRNIDTAAQTLNPKEPLLELKKIIEEHRDTPAGERRESAPAFRLCATISTIDIYRDGQLADSVKRSIADHAANGAYDLCQQEMIAAWKHNGFRKDQVFTRAYEALLKAGEKEEFLGCQRLLTLPPQPGAVKKLVHLKGTRKIATLSDNGLIYLHDLGQQSPPHPLEMLGKVTSFVVSDDARYLAAATPSGEIQLTALASGKRKKAAIQENILALCFDHAGSTCALGLANGTTLLYSFEGKKMRRLSAKESGEVRCQLFLYRSPTLVTGCADGTIRYWDLRSLECIRITEAHALPVDTLQVSPDDRLLLSASADRYLRLWDPAGGQMLIENTAHEESITDALITNNHRYCITGCEDDTVKVWDTGNGRLKSILNGRGDGILSLAWGPQSHIFLAGRQDGAITAWMMIYKFLFPPK